MSPSSLSHLLRRAHSRLGFCALFAAYAAALALAFDHWEAGIGPLCLYPVSRAAGAVLDAIGVATLLDARQLAGGLCVLTMEATVFHVTYECTGISALVIYLAAVLAHPTTAAHRVVGVLLGGSALFAYSVLRLVVLGVIARLSPEHTQFFHVYLLVLMNVGFMLYLWSSWVRRPVLRQGSHS